MRMERAARERFPDADPDRLPLLPRQVRTRDGHHFLPPGPLAVKMRQWVGALGADRSARPAV